MEPDDYCWWNGLTFGRVLEVCGFDTTHADQPRTFYLDGTRSHSAATCPKIRHDLSSKLVREHVLTLNMLASNVCACVFSPPGFTGAEGFALSAYYPTFVALTKYHDGLPLAPTSAHLSHFSASHLCQLYQALVINRRAFETKVGANGASAGLDSASRNLLLLAEGATQELKSVLDSPALDSFLPKSENSGEVYANIWTAKGAAFDLETFLFLERYRLRGDLYRAPEDLVLNVSPADQYEKFSIHLVETAPVLEDPAQNENFIKLWDSNPDGMYHSLETLRLAASAL